MASPAQVRLRAAVSTDKGPVRGTNEDSFVLDVDLGLMAVADGMGGHLGGEIASQTAVATLRQSLIAAVNLRGEAANDGGPGSSDGSGVSLSQMVEQALNDADASVRHLNAGRTGRDAMGTTIVGLLLPPGKREAVIFHVGDSRVYARRSGRLTCVTRDHSAQQAWLDGNRERARPPRNVISQALGVGKGIRPTLTLLTVEPEDTFILCSDGLSDVLGDEELERHISSADPAALEQGSAALVQAALAAGATDNITALLVAASGAAPGVRGAH